jgi:uncharacterized cupin superfamily protein
VSKSPATLSPSDAPKREGSRYPAPHSEPCMKRSKAILGDVFGLDQFGVNLATLAPGSWSSQRHWHVNEDEFVYVVEGQLTLCDDDGEHLMTPGMCAGFKANNGNGHCLKNLTDKPAIYLEVGTRAKTETGYYSDIDMMFVSDGKSNRFLHKDGSKF